VCVCVCCLPCCLRGVVRVLCGGTFMNLWDNAANRVKGDTHASVRERLRVCGLV
jgi:hypothetical protein